MSLLSFHSVFLYRCEMTFPAIFSLDGHFPLQSMETEKKYPICLSHLPLASARLFLVELFLLLLESIFKCLKCVGFHRFPWEVSSLISHLLKYSSFLSVLLVILPTKYSRTPPLGKIRIISNGLCAISWTVNLWLLCKKIWGMCV